MSLSSKDKKYILHPFTPYSEEKLNIPIIKANGELLWDENGKEYIDAISSWWVNLHGHTHPYINQKITEQLNQLEHVMFSGFTHQPAVELAEKLLQKLQPYYTEVFYSDNGSTSVEVALKMAIQYWKNQGIEKRKFIAFTNSYHGDTFGAMAVSERDVFTKPFHKHLFDVEYMEIPTEDNLDRSMEVLEQLLKEENIAGFIFEPLVQAAGGMRMYLAEHLDFLLRLCKDYDVLTIADEVMTGFGRTGKMFAIDHLQIKPDIICLSKGLTGGYLPLGITAFSNDIAQSFKSTEHIKTFYHGHSFTGNPISCSAALASLELFEIEKTFDKIDHIHNRQLDFADQLDTFEIVENARVTGTILAFDIKTTYSEYFYTNPVKETLSNYYLEQGIILRPLGNVVYILPPIASLTKVSIKFIQLYSVASNSSRLNYRAMDKYMVITSMGSVSALGSNDETILASLKSGKAHFENKKVAGINYPIFPIHANAELEIKELLHQNPKYKRSDRTAQLAILAAEKCFSKLRNASDHEWTINAGSSRGATGIWEDYHTEFIQEQTVPIKSSPLTTLGNISTHVAQHQKLQGFQIDHSITCSSGLQALANAFAWLRSGLTNHFIAIGTEAPLTDFTIAQMAILGIYTTLSDAYPCKPCSVNPDKLNTFSLGEAAICIAIENKETIENGDILLAGMGTASEVISNPTAISPYGDAFRGSIQKALDSANMKAHEIDLVIPHSPGTYQGDQAEYNAITSIFGDGLPKVINHKFLTGHTLGASGLLSVELGYYMLNQNISFDFPYPSLYPTVSKSSPQTVLINSMGFGGNAVSIILKKI